MPQVAQVLVGHRRTHGMGHYADALRAVLLQERHSGRDAARRLRQQQPIPVARLVLGRQHRHLQRQRRIPAVGEAHPEFAGDAVIRMQPGTVRQQHRAPGTLHGGVQGEETHALGQAQIDGIAHHQAGHDLVRPALLARRIRTRLAQRAARSNDGDEREDSEAMERG